MKPEDKLSIALNLPEQPIREFRKIVIPENPSEDFEIARRNIFEMLTRNADALEETMNMMAVSQHPRFVEAIPALVQAGLEASRDLAELEKKKLETEKLRGEGAKVINDGEMSSTEMLTTLKSG